MVCVTDFHCITVTLFILLLSHCPAEVIVWLAKWYVRVGKHHECDVIIQKRATGTFPDSMSWVMIWRNVVTLTTDTTRCVRGHLVHADSSLSARASHENMALFCVCVSEYFPYLFFFYWICFHWTCLSEVSAFIVVQVGLLSRLPQGQKSWRLAM